jgi:hypothetical protein
LELFGDWDTGFFVYFVSFILQIGRINLSQLQCFIVGYQQNGLNGILVWLVVLDCQPYSINQDNWDGGRRPLRTVPNIVFVVYYTECARKPDGFWNLKTSLSATRRFRNTDSHRVHSAVHSLIDMRIYLC